MNALCTFLAIGVSLAALLWLSSTDPKRRRSFGQPLHAGPRRTRLAWTIALVPGLVLPSLAGGPGFVLWLGALTVIGWGLIAIPPARGDAITTRIDRAAGGFGHWLDTRARRLAGGLATLGARLPRPATAAAAPGLAARVAELERRVRSLESELARARPGDEAMRDMAMPEQRDARVA